MRYEMEDVARLLGYPVHLPESEIDAVEDALRHDPDIREMGEARLNVDNEPQEFCYRCQAPVEAGIPCDCDETLHSDN